MSFEGHVGFKMLQISTSFSTAMDRWELLAPNQEPETQGLSKPTPWLHVAPWGSHDDHVPRWNMSMARH